MQIIHEKTAFNLGIVVRICIWIEKFQNVFNMEEEKWRLMKLCTIINWKNILYFLPYLFSWRVSLNKSSITGCNIWLILSVYMFELPIFTNRLIMKKSHFLLLSNYIFFLVSLVKWIVLSEWFIYLFICSNEAIRACLH